MLKRRELIRNCRTDESDVTRKMKGDEGQKVRRTHKSEELLETDQMINTDRNKNVKLVDAVETEAPPH